MKRVLFLAVLLFSLALNVSAQAALAPDEITGEVVYIPFPVSITVDGSLDDWAGVPVQTVDRGSMISPDPLQNSAFQFSVAADGEHIYITMTSDDSNIVTGQHGTNYWNEDSLEFYLNLSAERYATGYDDGMFQINITPGDIGGEAVTITGTNSGASNVRAVVFSTETGWGFEASVPLADYLTPAHGVEIGIQAHANGATELDRDSKLIWSLADTSDNSYSNPSLFGSGLFFEIGRTDIPMASEPPEPVEPVVEQQVSVNQVGYLPDAPKYGMFAGPGTNGTVWILTNVETGERVAAGFTTPGRLDEASGDYVQMADFSNVTTPGTYILTIDTTSSQPFRIGDDIYRTLPIDAARYFYLNRSGIELTAEHAGDQWARAAGHITDDVVTCWRGTDPQGVAWEGCDYTLNGRGGWYDAGDYGKYVVNGGISVWTLLNLYERLPDAYPDGSLNIPESGNDVPDLLDEARWEMEFLLAMQVPEGQPLAGMVHHKLHDRDWTGLPLMPPTTFDNNTDFANASGGRYVFPPSTAATLNVAATAAQCARIWREIDPDFAARCLTAAETAWRAANDNPIMLAGNVPGAGGGNYDDDDVTDEFYWAAAELFITTGSDEYRDYLTASPFYTAFPNMSGGESGSMFWGDVAALGTISLSVVPNDLCAETVEALREQIVQAADFYLSVIAREGYRLTFGAGQYNWGSNSDILNNAIILALAYDFTDDVRYRNGVSESMDYLLGRNALAFSFVSGYGARTLEHPHHRFWANQGDFPPPPPGVVAGGPNVAPSDPTALDAGVMDTAPAKRYVDLIGSWSTNEVTINWNAPLVWVSAYLDALTREN